MSDHAVRLPLLEVDVSSGLMYGVRQLPSPNSDARPEGSEPELIVVHGISLPPGAFGGPWIDYLFTNVLPADEHPYFAEISVRKVSAHLLVRRDGEITQYVPFFGRAWHAGQSQFDGRECCNDFSIGVELEGADTTPYTDVQYHVLANVVSALCRAYPRLSPHRTVGHSDISPGRKTDPGPAFDWVRARKLIALACRRDSAR